MKVSRIMPSFPSPVHPEVAELLQDIDRHPLPLLQTGSGPLPQAEQLSKLGASALFPNALLQEEAYAGLLLLLRSWDRSHEISQGLPSKEGSYWHAIAHRLEPDEFNSQYWFRRVGHHPIFKPLHEQAEAILGSTPIKSWKLGLAWDPALFGRWCEAARTKPNGPEERITTAIQQAEWNLLFSWCLQPSNEGN